MADFEKNVIGTMQGPNGEAINPLEGLGISQDTLEGLSNSTNTIKWGGASLARGLFDSKYHKSSIIGMAQANIFEFPVFISESVPLEYATATNTLLEQVYAAYLQMAISINPVVDYKMIRERQDHSQFAKYKTNTTKYLECVELDFQKEACHNEIYNEETNALFEFDMISIEDSEAAIINEAVDYQPLSEFDHYFQEGGGAAGRGRRRRNRVLGHIQHNNLNPGHDAFVITLPLIDERGEPVRDGHEHIRYAEYNTRNAADLQQALRTLEMLDDRNARYDVEINGRTERLTERQIRARLNSANLMGQNIGNEAAARRNRAAKGVVDDRGQVLYDDPEHAVTPSSQRNQEEDERVEAYANAEKALAQMLAAKRRNSKGQNGYDVERENKELQNEKIAHEDLKIREELKKILRENNAAIKRHNVSHTELVPIPAVDDKGEPVRDDNGIPLINYIPMNMVENLNESELKALTNFKNFEKLEQEIQQARNNEAARQRFMANHNGVAPEDFELEAKVKKDERDAMRESREQEKERREKKKFDYEMKATKAPQFIDETKIKKMNTMKPLMMTVNMNILAQDGTVSHPVEYVVGVKTHCRVIKSDILPEMVAYPVKEMNRISRRAKWRAGELKFFKDIVFHIKEKKQTAIDSRDPNRKWYRRLYELAHMKGDGNVSKNIAGAAYTHGLIPNASIIISKSDADNIEDAIDIDVMKPSVVSNLCEQLFLMNFIVVDIDNESIKIFTPDINNDYEIQSLAAVNKQIAELDTAGTSTRDIFKMLK